MSKLSNRHPLEAKVRRVRTTCFAILLGGTVFLLAHPMLARFWTWLTADRPAEWWAATGQWAGAIGTVAAVIVALTIAIRDGRIIQRDREERAEQQRREHVAHISAWPAQSYPEEDGSFPILLQNASVEPVYNVVIFPVFIQGAGPRTGEDWVKFDPNPQFATLGALLPGSWKMTIKNFDSGIMAGRPGVEIACTDRVGANWIRRATEELASISTNAMTYYALDGPFDFQAPNPA